MGLRVRNRLHLRSLWLGSDIHKVWHEALHGSDVAQSVRRVGSLSGGSDDLIVIVRLIDGVDEVDAFLGGRRIGLLVEEELDGLLRSIRFKVG